jgi:MYXO-CTERM domain-containing protein
MAWAPDGSNRLFFLLKSGEIRIVENGTPQTEPFGVVSPLAGGVECGLLGLAFDPGFATNGFLYVFATISTTEQQIIRYTADGNIGIDPRIVMAGLPTRGANHNGGAVGIGPDGKLYWAIGDNGNLTGVTPDLASLAAKIGRANLDGTAPIDNPFADGDGPNNEYVWASGLRNPFSFTFQPATERPWVSVAGGVFEQIFTPVAGDNAGWRKYESNQPNGFLAPAISYKTDDVHGVGVVANGAVRSAGIATFTTTPPHRFRPGAKITVTGVTDPSFNGDGYVVAVPTPTTFTFTQPGADTTSGGGVASSQALGGAVTGGGFWDSSALPPAYRGNFFFGDYNTGLVMRATLDATNHVKAVDTWASGNHQAVDVELGPDGALYYAGVVGTVYRASFKASAQGLVVSPLHRRTAEGAATTFSVRLAVASAAGVTVSLSRASGDSDLAVSGEHELTFGPTDWSQPQAVMLRAADDSDSIDDEALFDVTAPGLDRVTVRLRATDDDPFSVVVSTEDLELDEGGEAELQVWLSQQPAQPLDVSIAGLDGDEGITLISEPSLHFGVDDWSTPRNIVLGAAEDDDDQDGLARFALSGEGLTSRGIRVVAIDNDRLRGEGGAGGQAAVNLGGDAGMAGAETPPAAGAPDLAGGPADGGGAGAADPVHGTDDGGCACRAMGSDSASGAGALSLLLLAALRLLRRRR